MSAICCIFSVVIMFYEDEQENVCFYLSACFSHYDVDFV